ncbi:MAG: hypothetical protein HY927_07590 [Elusimicrobia bacterium]|nr:hypothetical protein [Elusimicrobiota bacterium]
MDLDRPIPLASRLVRKAWGSEAWLNAAHPGGMAAIRGGPGEAGGPATLAELVRRHPQVLGPWSRALFGDRAPVFAKLITTDFPPLAHIGFRRRVAPGAFLRRLFMEHALMRSLFGMLAVRDAARFAGFQRAYHDWAALQSIGGWRQDITEDLERALRRFLKPGQEASLASLLRSVRQNRALIAADLNEVDLREQAGRLILLRGGVIHSLFGLSHQVHPRDHAQAALQELITEIRARASRGAPGALLESAARRAHRWRPEDPAPKSEAWLPLDERGGLTLAEVQQAADTTHSLCDFFTPFVWKGRLAFRKGDPTTGLNNDDLSSFAAGVEFSPHRPADYLCQPATQRCRGGRLTRLLDAPGKWPFFSIYRLDLDGTSRAEAVWRADRPKAAFRHIVALGGSVAVRTPGRRAVARPLEPVFVPATLSTGYELASRGEASVLIIAVPGPRPGP